MYGAPAGVEHCRILTHSAEIAEWMGHAASSEQQNRHSRDGVAVACETGNLLDGGGSDFGSF